MPPRMSRAAGHEYDGTGATKRPGTGSIRSAHALPRANGVARRALGVISRWGVVEGAQQTIDFVERRTQLARVRVVGAGDPVEVMSESSASV